MILIARCLRRPLFMGFAALALNTVLMGAIAAQTLVIGDSLSAQYGIQPFSGSDDGPRARNWTEFTVSLNRLDFGNDRDLLFWTDVDEFNWSIPGAKTDDFRGTYIPLFGGDIDDDLDEVDRAIVFLGGNDVNSIYQDLYDDSVSQGEIDDLVDDIDWILDWIRDRNSSIPLYLCTIIDVGVTPDVRDDSQHSDPAKRMVATQNIAAINALLEPVATARNAVLIDMFAVSRDLAENGPPQFAGVQILPDTDPAGDNDQRYLFCDDGFHPNTSGQVLIANAILEAITANEPGASLPPVSHREALNLLGISIPASYAAYYEYVDNTSGGNLFNDNAFANNDGDPLTNAEEFLFGTDLAQPDGQVIFAGAMRMAAVLSAVTHGREWSYSLNTDALDDIDPRPRYSTDLNEWFDVPTENIAQGIEDNGLTPFTITLPGETLYLRLEPRFID